MAGNVQEWVYDWSDVKYYQTSPVENPTGPASGEFRVVRGGNWGSNAALLDSRYRFYLNPDYSSVSTGFRCAGE